MRSAELAFGALLLACGALAARAAEFEVVDKLTVEGGVAVSTKPNTPPLLFASSTAYQGHVGIGTTAPGQKLTVAGFIESTSGGFKFPDATVQTSTSTPAVLQVRVFSDYTYRTTGNGGYYYFGAPGQYDNAITPLRQDSVILVEINYFGESDSHDTMTLLQYSIGGGAWTNWDLVPNGQQGTFKPTKYNDPDNDSTPHNRATKVAKAFNTTQAVAFRLYHFNGGTFRHNTSINYTNYESGPSTLVLRELSAEKTSYVKR